MKNIIQRTNRTLKASLAAVIKELYFTSQEGPVPVLFSRNQRMSELIQDLLPIELQVTLWLLSDLRHVKGQEVGKVQIFLLSVTKMGLQRIVHKQNRPQDNRIYWLEIDWPTTGTIYVIDDGQHQIMKFAEEP